MIPYVLFKFHYRFYQTMCTKSPAAAMALDILLMFLMGIYYLKFGIF